LEIALAHGHAFSSKHIDQRSGALSAGGHDMKFPIWIKPGIYGAVVGAGAVMIFGFNWGGWVTGGDAEDMAIKFAGQEVTRVMVPVCMDLSASDPEQAAKLSTLRGVTSYSRQKNFMETGWATLPGTEEPNRFLAAACIKELEIDGS
jgi:hypothetical protein